MAILSGNILSKMILDACGIQNDRVRRVEIVCEAGEIAMVNVEFFAEMTSADGIVTAIQQFKLEAA